MHLSSFWPDSFSEFSGGKYRVFGRPLFYFGLVFFSLSLISSVMAPYRYDPQLIELVRMMQNVFLQVAFGLIVTVIFQSSSVTTGLVVVMTQNGLLTPATAIPVLLGANLGTPSTTLLVATRMNTSAKRAAVAHFLFNFIGVLIFLPFIGQLVALIGMVGGDPGQQVANAHLIFNLSCGIIFLALIHPFEHLVRRLVPGAEDDVVFIPEHLTFPLPDNTSDAFHLIEREIVHLFSISERLFAELHLTLDKPGQYSSRIGQLRSYAGYLDEQISDAALIISKRELVEYETAYIAGLVRISMLGQVLAYQTGDLCEVIHQLEEKRIELSAESKDAIRHSLVPCDMNLKTLVKSFPEITETVNDSMRSLDEILRDIMTLQYRQYLQRFASRESPAGSMFSRILFQIEGIAATIREIRKSSRLQVKMGWET